MGALYETISEVINILTTRCTREAQGTQRVCSSEIYTFAHFVNSFERFVVKLLSRPPLSNVSFYNRYAGRFVRQCLTYLSKSIH